MNNIAKTYVGVDVSKKNLDVYFYPENKFIHIKNNKEGVHSLTKKIKSYSLCEVTCEASGGYEGLLINACAKAHQVVRVENPRRIRNFAKAKGIKAKTDFIDAKIIALFAATFPPEYSQQNYVAKYRELQELVQYKDECKTTLAAEKLRLNGPVYGFVKSEIEKHIGFLKKQITKLDVKISRIIKEIEGLKEKSLIMQSMPGVGKETAIALIAYLPELGTLGPKKAAALVGVAPFTKESGQYKGVARIKDGRKRPRQALYMAALSASRFCPIFKEFYERLKNKGKPSKKALVAVMRRMIVVLDAMIAKNSIWVNKIA